MHDSRFIIIIFMSETDGANKAGQVIPKVNQ